MTVAEHDVVEGTEVEVEGGGVVQERVRRHPGVEHDPIGVAIPAGLDHEGDPVLPEWAGSLRIEVVGETGTGHVRLVGEQHVDVVLGQGRDSEIVDAEVAHLFLASLRMWSGRELGEDLARVLAQRRWSVSARCSAPKSRSAIPTIEMTGAPAWLSTGCRSSRSAIVGWSATPATSLSAA